MGFKMDQQIRQGSTRLRGLHFPMVSCLLLTQTITVFARYDTIQVASSAGNVLLGYELLIVSLKF